MARTWKVWVSRGGKNWRCRWEGKYGSGQNVFVYKKDADELCDLKKRNYQRQDAGLPPIAEQTISIHISEWAKRYLQERSKNPRQNTYRYFDKPAIEQFLEWSLKELGDIDIKMLTEGNIYTWKDWLYSEKEYDHTSVRMRLAHLRAAVGWAKKRGWVTTNVLENIELPQARKPGRVLTDEEIEKVYSILPHHMVLAFTVLLNSGMRKGELLGLKKTQVEKSEPWRVHFDSSQTKNKKPKSVVLTEAAKEAIQQALEVSKTEYVFDHVTRFMFDNWMQKIQEILGAVRLHDMKHTFCTHWMRQTGDLYGLQQLTGNSQSSLKIYNHLALGTPRGMANFHGFAPKQRLNFNVEKNA